MTGAVWINGAFDGRIDPADRGMTLGDGIFDTLVAFRRIPFAGGLHLARLTSQAASIGIAIDPARVRAGWDAVLARFEAEHAILRTTVTRGPSGRGLWPASAPVPTVIVSATAWDATLFGRPARLVTSAIRRNPGSPASRLKSLGYLDNVLAAREAAENGATDALFLTASGKAACTTIANVFALRGERLVTPPVEDGVMPGIMRALVLETAAGCGISAEETPLAGADLPMVDAMFLTNSVRFLSPVDSLDRVALGRRRAEIVAALLDAIAERVQAECGFDPRSGS